MWPSPSNIPYMIWFSDPSPSCSPSFGHTRLSMSLWKCGAQPRTQCSRCLTSSEHSGTVAFLDLDSVLLFVQIKIAFVSVCFLNNHIILLSYVELVVYLKPLVPFPINLCQARLYPVLGEFNVFTSVREFIFVLVKTTLWAQACHPSLLKLF